MINPIARRTPGPILGFPTARTRVPWEKQLIPGTLWVVYKINWNNLVIHQIAKKLSTTMV